MSQQSWRSLDTSLIRSKKVANSQKEKTKLFPTFFGYETFPDIFWLTTCQAISTLKKKHAVPTANRNTEASCTDSQQEHIPRVTIHQLPMTDL